MPGTLRSGRLEALGGGAGPKDREGKDLLRRDSEPGLGQGTQLRLAGRPVRVRAEALTSPGSMTAFPLLQ